MNEEEARERLGPECRPLRLVLIRPGERAFQFPDGALRRVRRILSAWVEAGRWWEEEQECAFFRMSLEDGGMKPDRSIGEMIVEVMHDPDDEWWLVRTLD